MLTDYLNFWIRVSGRIIRPSICLFQFHGKERQSLADVVVEFSGYAAAFFFLRFDQSAADIFEGFPCQLLIGHVDRGANKSCKQAFSIEPRRHDIQHPPINA